MNTVTTILLTLVLVSGCAAVLAPQLIQGALALAITSIVTALLLFQWGCPLAGVFELSVCAGLITVLFLSTISLTMRLTHEQEAARGRDRWGRFMLLPVLVCLLLAFLLTADRPFGAPAVLQIQGVPIEGAQSIAATDVHTLLWLGRPLDIIGQLLIVLGGALGVLVLFKRWEREQQ